MKKKNKQQYRIRNWSQYNKALASRGSITFWFDQQAIESWLDHSRSGKRGKPRTYGDACILCLLLLKNVYRLPQRATYGLVCSLMQLMKLDLPVPHPTILSRRASTLEVTLPRQKSVPVPKQPGDADPARDAALPDEAIRRDGQASRRQAALPYLDAALHQKSSWNSVEGWKK